MTLLSPINPFRARLETGRPALGVWSMLNSVSASEGLGWTGFDWILIDAEHSPVSLGDALDHLRAVSATPIVPICRVTVNDRALIKRYLDIGAQTLMVPYIQSADEAHEVVASMRYPQDGARGFAAMHRASRYGASKDYVTNAHERLFLIVQVETQAALGSIDQISAVPGVDAVFLGPGDLSADMGLLGKPGHDDVVIELEKALPLIKAAGKFAGVLAPSPDIAQCLLAVGYDFVSLSSDCALLFSGARALVSSFHYEEG